MVSACGMSMLDIENADDVMMVNSGGLCEQFVGQHLFILLGRFAGWQWITA